MSEIDKFLDGIAILIRNRRGDIVTLINRYSEKSYSINSSNEEISKRISELLTSDYPAFNKDLAKLITDYNGTSVSNATGVDPVSIIASSIGDVFQGLGNIAGGLGNIASSKNNQKTSLQQGRDAITLALLNKSNQQPKVNNTPMIIFFAILGIVIIGIIVIVVVKSRKR